MLYKLLSIIPYISLLLIGLFSYKLSDNFANPAIQSLLINLSASAFFVLIAYFLYEQIKNMIQKSESKYLDSYIQRNISVDIFATLYNLNKYVYGYKVESKTVNDIFAINDATVKKIQNLLLKQKYLGFLIYKNFEDYKDLFKGALANNLVIEYCSREKIILLLKIIDNIIAIEHLFKNENSYTKNIEKSNEFVIQHGKNLNSINPESSFLLLKKTKAIDKFVVYDSGEIEQRYESKMLNVYTLTDNAAGIISNEIYKLVKTMNKWLPKKVFLPRQSKKHRVIKNFYNSFTNIFTSKRKIYIGDIIESKLK
jgi:hypothetical protein